MDWLAEQILAVLSETVSDADYMADKRESFQNLDRLGAAKQIGNLDGNNQALLAERLGVHSLELEAFVKVLATI